MADKRISKSQRQTIKSTRRALNRATLDREVWSEKAVEKTLGAVHHTYGSTRRHFSPEV